jgi:hypothetical protein
MQSKAHVPAVIGFVNLVNIIVAKRSRLRLPIDYVCTLGVLLENFEARAWLKSSTSMLNSVESSATRPLPKAKLQKPSLLKYSVIVPPFFEVSC